MYRLQTRLLTLLSNNLQGDSLISRMIDDYPINLISIFSYNLKVYIELQNLINESTLVCARPGELFAKVPLEGQLSDDTDAGKLILSSVFNVLIAPHSTDGKIVYEAVIVQKENFNFDGKGKDYIYLCLSPK